MGMAAYKENVPGTRESPVVRGWGYTWMVSY